MKPPRSVQRYLRALRVALAFLTTLPVPNVRTWHADDLRLAVQAYPVVGLVIGSVLALASLVTSPLPPLLFGVLITALWLLVTGALHFDGFCDLADAALAPKPPQERWRIVKDPRLGSFALAAGSVLILVKVAAIGELAQRGSLPLLLTLVPVVSRSAVTLAMAHFPVYDSSLLGRSAQLSWNETVIPLISGLILSAWIARFGLSLNLYLVAALSAGLVVMMLGHVVNARMRGLGGDAYGALIEASEAVMLVVAVTMSASTR